MRILARRTIGSEGAGPLGHTRCVTIRRLNALYLAMGVAMGMLMPFTVPLLVAHGLEAAQIGLVLGVTGLASLVAYPIWGAVADGFLGRPRTVVLAAIVSAVGGIAVILAGADPVLLTAALSLVAVGVLAYGPLVDAITLGELGDASSGFGRVRVWASVGWAASAVVAGAAWFLLGPTPVLLAFSAASLSVGLLALRPGRAARGAGDRLDADGSAAGSSDGSAGHGTAPARRWRGSLRGWRVLLSPVLLGFLLGLLVTSIGEHASWRFVSLLILDQGGGVLLVGLAAALPAVVEVPVFASSRVLAGRLGLRLLFVVGAIIAAVIMALIAVAPEAWMVTGLRAMEGTSYALRYTAMVLIIGVLMPRHLYALGQSIAWFAYAGISPILADILGGLIYDYLGAQALFLVATATLVVGGLIVWFVLAGPTFARREARVDSAALPLEVPPPG